MIRYVVTDSTRGFYVGEEYWKWSTDIENAAIYGSEKDADDACYDIFMCYGEDVELTVSQIAISILTGTPWQKPHNPTKGQDE